MLISKESSPDLEKVNESPFESAAVTVEAVVCFS